jgi:membrane-associated protease RseP (regulator of RpoE activity)
MRSGTKSPSFYPIPGIPIVFFSASFGALIIPLPTFGTVIVPRERLVNRDSVFNISLAGPLVGVLVVLLVSFFGALTSVTIPIPSTTLGSISFSILQRLVETVAGGAGLSGQVPVGYVRIASPLALAGWVGFFILFLNMLPAGLLDGGYMSWAVFGPRGTRIAFLLTILLLLAIDIPSYWFVAILILITAGGTARIETLDSISDVSPRKKFVFLAVILIALLSLPVPQTLATIPLGLGQ